MDNPVGFWIKASLLLALWGLFVQPAVADNPGPFASIMVSDGDNRIVFAEGDPILESECAFGSDIKDIVLSPDGSYLYVGDFPNDRVIQINLSDEDLSCDVVVDDSDGLDGPRGMAFTPDGQRFFVVSTGHPSNQGSYKILVFDVGAGFELLATIPSAPYGDGIAMDPAGEFFYVSFEEGGQTNGVGGKIIKYNAADYSEVGIVASDLDYPQLDGPRGLAIGPDGLLYVCVFRIGPGHRQLQKYKTDAGVLDNFLGEVVVDGNSAPNGPVRLAFQEFEGRLYLFVTEVLSDRLIRYEMVACDSDGCEGANPLIVQTDVLTPFGLALQPFREYEQSIYLDFGGLDEQGQERILLSGDELLYGSDGLPFVKLLVRNPRRGFTPTELDPTLDDAKRQTYIDEIVAQVRADFQSQAGEQFDVEICVEEPRVPVYSTIQVVEGSHPDLSPVRDLPDGARIETELDPKTGNYRLRVFHASQPWHLYTIDLVDGQMRDPDGNKTSYVFPEFTRLNLAALGVSQQLDTGNLDEGGKAWVFVEAHRRGGLSAHGRLRELANSISHEVAHLLGLEHTDGNPDSILGPLLRFGTDKSFAPPASDKLAGTLVLGGTGYRPERPAPGDEDWFVARDTADDDDVLARVQGSIDCGFDRVRGLTVGPDEALYIASAGNDTIYRYDPVLEECVAVISQGVLDEPRHIAFNDQGHLYVTSHLNYKLFAYERTGKNEFQRIGAVNVTLPGKGDGLVIDEDGYFYVSIEEYSPGQGTGPGPVRKYSPDFQSWWDIASPASANVPRGLAIGPEGSLYVCSAMGRTIKKYSRDHQNPAELGRIDIDGKPTSIEFRTVEGVLYLYATLQDNGTLVRMRMVDCDENGCELAGEVETVFSGLGEPQGLAFDTGIGGVNSLRRAIIGDTDQFGTASVSDLATLPADEGAAMIFRGARTVFEPHVVHDEEYEVCLDDITSNDLQDGDWTDTQLMHDTIVTFELDLRKPLLEHRFIDARIEIAVTNVADVLGAADDLRLFVDGSELEHAFDGLDQRLAFDGLDQRLLQDVDCAGYALGRRVTFRLQDYFTLSEIKSILEDGVLSVTLHVGGDTDFIAVDSIRAIVVDDGQRSEFECGLGTVNIHAGRRVETLLVNGSTGGDLRTVAIQEGETIRATMLLPSGMNGGELGVHEHLPSDSSGEFVVHMNAEAPSELLPDPLRLDGGLPCFGFSLLEGAAPLSIWNGLGKETILGMSNYFGNPIPNPLTAPTLFWLAPGGDALNLPSGTTITLQGIIADAESGGTDAVSLVSLTNAVIIKIVD